MRTNLLNNKRADNVHVATIFITDIKIGLNTALLQFALFNKTNRSKRERKKCRQIK